MVSTATQEKQREGKGLESETQVPKRYLLEHLGIFKLFNVI
jgi:hypothetical protein